jgi:hypothetical protein
MTGQNLTRRAPKDLEKTSSPHHPVLCNLTVLEKFMGVIFRWLDFGLLTLSFAKEPHRRTDLGSLAISLFFLTVSNARKCPALCLFRATNRALAKLSALLSDHTQLTNPQDLKPDALRMERSCAYGKLKGANKA